MAVQASIRDISSLRDLRFSQKKFSEISIRILAQIEEIIHNELESMLSTQKVLKEYLQAETDLMEAKKELEHDSFRNDPSNQQDGKSSQKALQAYVAQRFRDFNQAKQKYDQCTQLIQRVKAQIEKFKKEKKEFQDFVVYQIPISITILETLIDGAENYKSIKSK